MSQDEFIEGPWRDPIVEQVRAIREEQSARFNFDVRAIIEDARTRQKASDHEVLTLLVHGLPGTREPTR